MERYEYTGPALIERGRIKDKRVDPDGPVYKVQSWTRSGVITRWIPSIGMYIKEYTGDAEDKYEYEKGDNVVYFMFADGRGMILGKMHD